MASVGYVAEPVPEPENQHPTNMCLFCFYVFHFNNFYVHLITYFANCCAVLLLGTELRITCNLVALGIISYANSSSVK